MSMGFGSSRRDLERRMVLQPGETVVSARKYNAVIGLVLAWGFILNFFTIFFFEDYFIELFTVKYTLTYLLVGYLVCVLVGWLFVRSKSAFLSFIGYNFIAVPVGIVLSVSLQGYDTDIIMQAVLATAIVTVLMFVLALLFPKFFLKSGRVIFFALLTSIVVELGFVMIFKHKPVAADWIATALLSMYIGYDWARANKCQKTLNNAIDISTALYLDLINLFMRLLEIVGKNKAKS